MTARENTAATDVGYHGALRQGFTALFRWHFDRGTRPGLSMQVHGNSWDAKEFAAHIKTEIRNAQNWYNGTSAPKGLFKKVENAFFGDPGQLTTDPYAQWRADFRAAHKADRASRDGSPDANQEEAALLPPSASAPVQVTFADAELADARTVNAKPNPTLIKVTYTIAGATAGLLGQGIIVAISYWLTGLPIESVVGLFGAHVLPVAGAAVGAMGGIALLASRTQRSNNPVPSQL